jgi:hypothetical protein
VALPANSSHTTTPETPSTNSANPESRPSHPSAAGYRAHSLRPDSTGNGTNVTMHTIVALVVETLRADEARTSSGANPPGRTREAAAAGPLHHGDAGRIVRLDRSSGQRWGCLASIEPRQRPSAVTGSPPPMTAKFVSNPAAPTPSTAPEFVINQLPNLQSKPGEYRLHFDRMFSGDCG